MKSTLGVAKYVSNFSLIFHDGKSILMGGGRVVLYFIVIFVSVYTKVFTITIECFHRHWKSSLFCPHFSLSNPPSPFPSMSEHFLHQQ